MEQKSKTPKPWSMALNAAALRWFNELSTQGILITDAELRIRGWNNWLESHTGLRAEEVIGQNLLDVYPNLDARGIDEYYKDALAGQVRVIAQRLHGYLLPVPPATGDASFENMQQSARIAPLSEGGRVIGTVTVIDDVTERVAREDQLVHLLGREKAARAEAEAANRAKDEFLATVSHELRTPLNSILGWVQLLRSQKPDAAALQRGLEAVERSARAQTVLIEDILDASRITTGKLHLDVRPVDLVAIVSEAVDTMRPSANEKAIELRTTLKPLDGPVSGDPNRLTQLVCNLLSNAIKFTPRAGRVEVILEPLNTEVELTVTDTGKGIPADFLPFVFDRFRQADSSSARQYGGLGLGLAMVRYLVETHGGTVYAESDGEGRGATFKVRLPLVSIDQATDPAAIDGSVISKSVDGRSSLKVDFGTLLNGLRVLVVDDEADAREMLSLMLAYLGVEVKTTATVADALALLEKWHPDVLVSDIGMPNEDGYSLIGRLRALDAQHGGQIPAVALTGYAGPENNRRVLSAGYQVCVAKPVDFAELGDILARLGRPDGSLKA
jgi:PAS domain S-box-containing protein